MGSVARAAKLGDGRGERAFGEGVDLGSQRTYLLFSFSTSCQASNGLPSLPDSMELLLPESPLVSGCLHWKLALEA